MLPPYQGQNDHGRLRDGHCVYKSSMSESLLLEVRKVWTGCHSILLREADRNCPVNDILDHMFYDTPHPLGGYASIHNRL